MAARLVEALGAEALHRSFPHARDWPTLSELSFDAAIVMTRDWWAAARAQRASNHVADEAQALRNLRRAYASLTEQLSTSDKPWRFVSYESLVTYPDTGVQNLAAWLELDAGSNVEAIYDGNEKWLSRTT